MKKINVSFEQDETLADIDVTVRADKFDDEVGAVMDRIMGSSEKSIQVTGNDGVIEVLPVSEIIMLSVNDKQVSILTENCRYTTKLPLNRIESELEPQGFVRISRYEIVNLAKVERYDFTLGGTLRIELTGGMETWASRRCIPQIRRKLSGKE